MPKIVIFIYQLMNEIVVCSHQLTQLRKLKINNLNSFKELEVILKPPCPFSLHSLVLDEVSTKMEETDLRQLSMCRHLYELFLGGEISNLPGHGHFPSNLTKLTLSYSLLKQDPIPILERLPYLTILRLFNSYDGELNWVPSTQISATLLY